MNLSTIDVKDFENLSGRHLKFFDRLGFKLAQKKLRNSINADGTIDNKKLNKFLNQGDHSTGFHLGGFALGFLVGLIGVLIAYLINDDNKQNRVKWARSIPVSAANRASTSSGMTEPAGRRPSPALIDNQAVGHQLFPDISAGGGGVLHAIWWDSRNDPNYSRTRPIGNDANGVTGASIDVYGATSANNGTTWTGQARVTTATSNPNYEQFSNRTVPFAGDYLWVTSSGTTAFGAWTDWRNTVAGADPREATAEDNDAADVSNAGRSAHPRAGAVIRARMTEGSTRTSTAPPRRSSAGRDGGRAGSAGPPFIR